jgi:hypothetical protein
MEANELVETQLKRIITSLFKNFLVIVEDIRQDHLQTVADMSHEFPPEILQKWNYLDLPKYSRIRKKVLDDGNEKIREITTLLNSFDINIKQ